MNLRFIFTIKHGCSQDALILLFGIIKRPAKNETKIPSLIFRLMPRELAPCAHAGCRVSQGPSLNHS